MKISFIGLGVMGFPMAGYLSKNGHDVSVFNRTTAKAESWVAKHGGHFGLTPKDTAKDSEMVMLCVGNDDDVREVISGDQGVIHSMKPGSVLIDHTTASAELALEMAALCQSKGIAFIDAPVSGGQAGAENGQLTIMCGGAEADFERALPVMACFGKKVTLMGESGQGQKTKMVNQLLIAGLLQGLSEGIQFAVKSGLDIDKVIDVISGGAAQSWQLENRAKTMAEGKFDFGFAIDWMRKDLAICFDEAEKIGVDTPVAKMVDQFYRELQEQGFNRDDTSSLIKRL